MPFSIKLINFFLEKNRLFLRKNKRRGCLAEMIGLSLSLCEIVRVLLLICKCVRVRYVCSYFIYIYIFFYAYRQVRRARKGPWPISNKWMTSSTTRFLVCNLKSRARKGGEGGGSMNWFAFLNGLVGKVGESLSWTVMFFFFFFFFFLFRFLSKNVTELRKKN